MEFAETDTQSLLRDTAERFVRDRYDFDTRKQILADHGGFSSAVWSQFAELGILGVEIGEDHGGSGGTFADLAVVLEALGRGLVVEPYLSSIVMCGGLVRTLASKSQRDDLLPGLAAGEIRLALAYSEPGGRYALSHVETKAAQTDGCWLINGHKSIVLDGAGADCVIVSARTSGKTDDVQGVSLFLVKPDSAGITIQDYANMDDRPAADVLFENVNCDGGAMIGEAGQGLAALESAIDRANAALCCEAFGAMNALNELTLDYLKTRQQFGRPIGKFQALQHRFADMMIAGQLAGSMSKLAIAAADNPDPLERAKAISAAKVQITNSARDVGRGAIQLHGGIGMTDEYIAGHYFRRLTSVEKMFGDSDYHLDRFSQLS